MILCCCPNLSVDTRVHIDALQIGAVNRATHTEEFPGGKGVHVALAAHALGADVCLLGIWGGSAGAFIRQNCEARGIRCIGPNINQENRRCLSFTDNDTEVLMPGPQIDECIFDEYLAILKTEAQAADLVSISGSWPQGAPSDAYAQCVQLLNALEKAHLIDCSGEQLTQALEAKPYAVHCNSAEIKDCSHKTNVAEQLDYLKSFCQLSVLTCGSEGLFLAKNDTVVHSLCSIEHVISSVGCGDAVCAAVVVSLAKQSTLSEMASLASACGAANCLNADLGMIHSSDVERFITSAETKIIKQEYTHALS